MKWIGYRQVRVSSLNLPGDVTKRQAQQHVIDLAADIRELGDEPINAPVFDSTTGEIIAGRDRMAALLTNKVRYCWVRLAECTAQERSDLEVSENLHRRVDDRNELIARRVHRVAETIARDRATTQSGTNVPAKAGPGNAPGGTNVPLSPPSSRDVGAARVQVAREVGISPEGIRKAEQRAAKASKDIPAVVQVGDTSADALSTSAAGGGGEPAITHLVCPVDALGVEVPNELCDAWRAVQVSLDAADKLLRQAQATVTGGLAKSTAFPGAIYQRIRERLHDCGELLRQVRPASVCPYCKLTAQRSRCNGCVGWGYLRVEQMGGVPRELLAGNLVAVDGQFVARASVKAPKPVARRVTVQMPDGSVFDHAAADPPTLDLPLEPAEDTQ